MSVTFTQALEAVRRARFYEEREARSFYSRADGGGGVEAARVARVHSERALALEKALKLLLDAE